MIAIFFPMIIALLVPVRFLLSRIFTQKDLANLDAEETPELAGVVALAEIPPRITVRLCSHVLMDDRTQSACGGVTIGGSICV